MILQTLLFWLLAAGPLQQGPWVYGARENSVNVLWISEKPGMAYVELEDGSVHYDTYAGRRIFKRLHRVRLAGLAPGATVRYRVCGVDLADDSNPYDPEFGEAYEGPWHSTRTFDRKAAECNFSVFNDIHMRTEDYAALAAQVDSARTDFLFLNGDIVTAGNYELDTLVHYAIEPLGGLPAGIPVLFARGNHEGRGNNVELISEIYPNDAPAPFYYTFRHGPVAFIVFDAGETGRHRSNLYSGADVYEDYLTEQLAWAAKAVRDPAFRSAPLKICLLHVPMIDHEDKTDYLLQRWLNVHFMSLLNKAGIDLMIGADLHEQMYCAPGTMGNKFPIVVNDDARRLDVRCTRKGYTLKMYSPAGDLEFER
jgi:hypothetical protein